MLIRAFARPDTEPVVALWEVCGLTRPWNDPRKDIERKLAVQPELFLVGEEGDAVVATAMAGYDGHRGWIYYVAVAPHRQGSGLGRRLLAEVESRLTAIGCPKVNVQVRRGNEKVDAFWSTLGYTDDAVSGRGKRLLPDT